MATLKKNISSNKNKMNHYCNIHIPDSDVICTDCKNSKITDNWCDLKCVLKNHYVNTKRPGFVCEDFEQK